MLPGVLPLQHFLTPIEHHLADSERVKEIVINEPGEVGIETKGWEWIQVPEFTAERIEQISILTCQLSGHNFDEEHPIGKATLPGGQRYTALRDPATNRGKPSVTIRVPHEDERDIFDPDFLQMTRNTNKGKSRRAETTEEMLQLYKAHQWPHFFDLAVRKKFTIIAIGKTGKGKTSMIRRLSRRVPLYERVVTLEDTSEYGKMLQKNRVAVFYGTPNVTALDAMEVSLRMRPDRIIMQELRGAEAFSFLRAELAGHRGGMTTLHAEMDVCDAESTFEALELMVRAHPHSAVIPDAKLRDMIRRHVDIIVSCDRDEDTDEFDLPYVWFRDAEDAA